MYVLKSGITIYRWGIGRCRILIRSFCGTVSENRETAIGVYSRICDIFMISELSLSEYIFRLAIPRTAKPLVDKPEAYAALGLDTDKI